MTLLQLSVVLLAAVFHASWNIASKYGAGAGYYFAFFYKLFSCLFYLPWVGYLIFVEGFDLSLKILLILGLSAILHLLYSLSLLKGYQKANLSIVYPVSRGSGPLITSFVAVSILQESLDKLELLGIVVVCFGVLLIAVRGRLSDFIGPSGSWVGVRWGLFIGCTIASYSLVDAYAVKTLLIAPVLVSWVSSLGGTLMLVPSVIAGRKMLFTKMRRVWPYAFFVGVLSPLAYILILYVLRNGAQISIVAPLRESSMVFGTLAGVLLFKEKVSPLGWAGCLLILTGVFLIAW